MKRNLLLLSGLVLLSVSANAQQLKEDYMVWPSSGNLSGYVNEWTPGTPLFEDENFYISRVKPKDRFRNAKTQINEGLTEANDKKLIFWVPIGSIVGGYNPNARPNGIFDSEVFSSWSYVTHFGNWSSPHGWVPGGFADVAHKNGVAVSGVASVPWGGITKEWAAALTAQTKLDNEKLAKFLYYHGVDGLGYNSEFSGLPTAMAPLRAQHEAIHKYLVGKGNNVAENVWYDGTNDNGNITFDNGIGNHNKETFGDGEHIRTSLFFNYNWWRSNVLSSLANFENVAPGRNPLDIYAGFNMQGGDPSTWTTLAQYPMSIGLWGAHDYNMLWAGRSKKGSTDVAKQKTYQEILEMFFTNGNRNPVKTIDIFDSRSHFPDEDWFGMSAFMSARSSLSWDLAEEPFVTFFNLGNGSFFNWKGNRENNNEWYNIGVQDYLPTWRYWFASSFLGKKATDVPEKGLDAQFTWNDAYVGGSCLRVSGETADEYLHLFKTNFTLKTGDVITVRYKLVNGQGNVNLILSARGDETTILRESNLNVVSSTQEANDEVWVEKKFEVRSLLTALNNKEIAMIGLHFTNTKNFDFYLGEFSINRGTTATPAAPTITLAKVLANHYKGVDAKVIFNMPNNKEAGTPVYNIDVNTSMFKLYAQQEGGNPTLIGITTSWAGMYYSIPTDKNGTQRVRLGVAAVSVDTQSDSEITWSNYMDMGTYTAVDNIQINKTTIKPNEDFEISYVDQRHSPSDWKLYNSTGEVVAQATQSVKLSMPNGLEALGAYDLEVIEVDTIRRINNFAQITGWDVGALPQIKSLTVNESPSTDASPIKIEIGNELTLGYTGREADGAASRGIEIDEGWVGGPMKPLGISTYQSFSVSAWVKFTSLPGSTCFFSIENRKGSWPMNNWGWFWSNVGSEGKIDTYTFRSSTTGGSAELKYSFPKTQLMPNAWNHVALTFEYNQDGKFRSRFYVNGVLQESKWEFGTKEKGTTDSWCSVHFGIAETDWMGFGGGRGSEATYNNGVVDELQVWNGVMTPEEIQSSKAGLNANSLPANVLAYWDFDTNAENSNYFMAKGTKPEAKACIYKMVATENEGSGVQTPQQPRYISGTPFIPGSAYKITTSPTWTTKRALISEAKGTATAGVAKLSYSKAGDYTVTLTLENTLGADSKNYPVFTVKDPSGIEDMDDAGELRTYTVDDALFIEFAEDGNYQIAVYNISGMLIAQKSEAIYSGQNMRIALGTNGIYVIKVLKDSKEARTIKVLKN